MAKLFNIFGKKNEKGKTEDASELEVKNFNPEDSTTFEEEESESAKPQDIIPDTEPTRGLFVAPPKMRVDAICDRYLLQDEADEQELYSYDFVELAFIITNAQMVCENQFKENEELCATLKEKSERANQVAIEKMKKNDYYVIYFRKTETPFMISQGVALAYEQDFRADEVCLFLNYKNQAQGTFYKVKYTEENKKEMFRSLKAMGVERLCLEGSKLHVPMDILDEQDYGDEVFHPQIGQAMELLIQGEAVMKQEVRNRLNTSIAAMLIELGKKILVPSYVEASGNEEADNTTGEKKVRIPCVRDSKGNNWFPIFVDQCAFEKFAANNQDETFVAKTDTFENVFKNLVYPTKEFVGFLVNSGRENYSLDKRLIAAMLASKAKSDVLRADTYYMIYSNRFGGKYPLLNIRGEAFGSTDRTVCVEMLNKMSDLDLSIKEFSKADFERELLSYYPLGICEIVIDRSKFTREELLRDKADPNGGYKYSGSSTVMNLIRYGQVSGVAKPQYRNSANTYWAMLSDLLPQQLFLVPAMLPSDGNVIKSADKKFHFSKPAMELLTKKLTLLDAMNHTNVEDETEEVSEFEAAKKIKNFQLQLPIYGAADFEAPINAEHRQLRYLMANNGQADILAVFTDYAAFRKLFGEKARVGIITYDEAVKLSQAVSGMVINPGEVSFVLTKEGIELLQKAHEDVEKRKAAMLNEKTL